jgi:hypothetical protein
MIIKSLDHLLSVTDPFGFLSVSQGLGNPSQMKTFRPKPFVQVGSRLWRDPQESRKSASCCMWVPLEAISENFIETGRKQSSGPLFIGKILSLSPNFPYPKENLNFLHRSLVADISQAIKDYQELGCHL